MPAHFGKLHPIYMRFRRWTRSDFRRELAYKKNDDAALRQMLEQIVRFGDWYTQRTEQRLNSKAHRVNYDAQRAADRALRRRAAPTNGQVAAGTAAISTTGNTAVINQSSNRAL